MAACRRAKRQVEQQQAGLSHAITAAPPHAQKAFDDHFIFHYSLPSYPSSVPPYRPIFHGILPTMEDPEQYGAEPVPRSPPLIDTDVVNDPRSTTRTAVDQPRVLAF
jgi:hypothetical protein